MHEFSIVQALLEQVEQAVRQAGTDGRVVRLEVHVGRLSGVHIDALKFAFELLAPESIAAEAQLDVISCPAQFRCHECGSQGEIDNLSDACSTCGARDIAIFGGQDLVLQSIELDADELSGPPV